MTDCFRKCIFTNLIQLGAKNNRIQFFTSVKSIITDTLKAVRKTCCHNFHCFSFCRILNRYCAVWFKAQRCTALECIIPDYCQFFAKFNSRKFCLSKETALSDLFDLWKVNCLHLCRPDNILWCTASFGITLQVYGSKTVFSQLRNITKVHILQCRCISCRAGYLTIESCKECMIWQLCKLWCHIRTFQSKALCKYAFSQCVQLCIRSEIHSIQPHASKKCLFFNFLQIRYREQTLWNIRNSSRIEHTVWNIRPWIFFGFCILPVCLFNRCSRESSSQAGFVRNIIGNTYNTFCLIFSLYLHCVKSACSTQQIFSEFQRIIFNIGR